MGSVESVASGSTQGPDSEEGAEEASEPVEEGWSAETASERAQPDLPPHLAFDGASASLLFQPPWRQEERKHLTVRNVTDGPLDVSVDLGAVDQSVEGMSELVSAVELVTLGSLALEPGESFQLLVLRRPLLNRARALVANRQRFFTHPVSVELGSRTAAGEELSAEVELVFFEPDGLLAQERVMARPYSTRVVVEYRVGPAQRGMSFWLRTVAEEGQPLVVPTQPGVFWLLEGPAAVSLPFRLSRVPGARDLVGGERGVTNRVLFLLAEYTEASAEEAALVRGTREAEERHGLVQELAAAAFAAAPHRYPVQHIRRMLHFLSEPSLQIFPPDLLQLTGGDEPDFVYLRNSSRETRLAWSVGQPSPAPLRLSEAEGVLGPGSKGHLLVSALPRASAGPRYVSLTFRFARCPADGHPALPDRPGDFLDQEPMESLAHLTLAVLLPS